MNSDPHTLLEHEMYSTFWSWQLALSSHQPQLRAVKPVRKHRQSKAKQNHCCPKSPLGSQTASASQITPLGVFTCALRPASWGNNLAWSDVCTIHHLRHAKHYLVTVVALNKNLYYLEKKKWIHPSLKKGNSFQVVQLSRQISLWMSSSYLDSIIFSKDGEKKNPETQQDWGDLNFNCKVLF